MGIGIGDNLSDLLVARRLLLSMQQAAARQKGKPVKKKSAKEAMEEDQALISGKTDSAQAKEAAARTKTDEDLKIKLSDLIGKLNGCEACAGGKIRNTAYESFTATYHEVEVKLEIKAWAPVQGLVRRDQHLTESDRYTFEFQDALTFKITDKWSGKSTTIWGDPHVDVSDEEGNRDGEFTDLTGSQTHTTLMMEDGTQVTFTALDNGIIEQVDIIKGDQHLTGIGAASLSFSEENALFATPVQEGVSSSAPMGDVVYAGGDGNDWYDNSGQLIWGKTTGTAPFSPPAAIVEIDVRERFEQVSWTRSLDRSI